MMDRENTSLLIQAVVAIFAFVAFQHFTSSNKAKREAVLRDGELQLIPRPINVQQYGKRLALFNPLIIYYHDERLASIANLINESIHHHIGFKTQAVFSERHSDRGISLQIIPSDKHEESYTLNVDSIIVLQANSEKGIFRGSQTLLQMLMDYKRTKHIYLTHIEDAPSFEWRGLLLDVCRHFFSKEFIKKYIDIMALYKMNVLHWHLTEDQAWRIEIKKYPKLTAIGAYRRLRDDEMNDQFAKNNAPYMHTIGNEQLYGGYYTQEDVKEIVQYAAERHITVVPEIELPGHAVAALAAFPEYSCTGGPFHVQNQFGVHHDVYCAGNPQTYEFIQGILEEVMELFPSEYIHIGGDECPKQRWSQCKKCQHKIKEEGLRNEHELQSYFIKRISNFVASKGRKIIGWDEILEGGLVEGATVQAWRSMQAATIALKSGHDAIVSPNSHCYLDYEIKTIDLEQIYSFDPASAIPSWRSEGKLLGGECNVWTEYMQTEEQVNYMVFPRMLAMSTFINIQITL